MRALQGSFSRLKTRLTSDSHRRGQILQAVMLLHNYRTHHEGLNQIANVFNPEYEEYISVDGYDRIKRYFDN
jgi:alpha-acetolactate decarboxylase